MNKEGYKFSHIDHVSARSHGWMLDSWKIITLFVFGKIEIYCSQNAFLLWSGRGQPADEPSLNSYVQDFLIY